MGPSLPCYKPPWSELVAIDEVVEPEPTAAATYAEQLPVFAELYDALMPAFRALQR